MILKTYSIWAFIVGITFFSIYPVCNWISSKRSDVSQLYFSFELKIPFIPEFIFVYLSMYILFFLPPFFLNENQLKVLAKQIIIATLVSGIFFLLFPSQLGYERIIPNDYLGSIFNRVFSLDLPYNMVPSLHVVYSGFILLSIFDSINIKSLRVLLITWLGMIILSTLLVHQHHIIDIIVALAIIFVIKYKFKQRNTNV